MLGKLVPITLREGVIGVLKLGNSCLSEGTWLVSREGINRGHWVSWTQRERTWPLPCWISNLLEILWWIDIVSADITWQQRSPWEKSEFECWRAFYGSITGSYPVLIPTRGGLGPAEGWNDSSCGCQASFHAQPQQCLCNGTMNIWAIFAGTDDTLEANGMDFFSPRLAREVAT